MFFLSLEYMRQYRACCGQMYFIMFDKEHKIEKNHVMAAHAPTPISDRCSLSATMNRTIRNSALGKWLSLMPLIDDSLMELIDFSAGQELGCTTEAQQLVFPEQGILALQAQTSAGRLDAGLLGSASGAVLRCGESSTWQLRALGRGQAYVLTLADPIPAACTDVLLEVQMSLMQHVALWAHCRQQHPLAQRLATLLLVLHQHAPRWCWQDCWTRSLTKAVALQPLLICRSRTCRQTRRLARPLRFLSVS